MPLPSPHLRFPARMMSLPCAAPWDILDAPSPAAVPAFLWRGRDEREVWLGLGWAGVFASLEECRAALAAVDLEADAAEIAPRCFAACAFDAEAPLIGIWEGFHARLFVLPETLIHWQDGRADILFVRPVFGTATHQDLHADFEAGAAQLKVLLQHREPRRNLNFRAEKFRFDETHWTAAVQQISDNINAGQLRKAVLARSQSWTANHPLSCAPVLEHLAGAETGCAVYAQRMGTSAFLGATPERLFRFHGSTLEVESLAGTRPRGKTAEEDELLADELLASIKDAGEQQIVTDFLREHLLSWSSGEVAAAKPQVRKLAHVQHLISTLSANVRAVVEPDKILNALHPTPAVCGSPREDARSLLRELEPESRGLYAGAFGWVNRDQIEMSVMLRCALIKDTTATLFAGAGIVADSDAHREWEETGWKMRPMQHALGIET